MTPAPAPTVSAATVDEEALLTVLEPAAEPTASLPVPGVHSAAQAYTGTAEVSIEVRPEVRHAASETSPAELRDGFRGADGDESQKLRVLSEQLSRVRQRCNRLEVRLNGEGAVMLSAVSSVLLR